MAALNITEGTGNISIGQPYTIHLAEMCVVLACIVTYYSRAPLAVVCVVDLGSTMWCFTQSLV